MASIGLGAVEEFPFLDPPDKRQIRDGLNLLNELGALEQKADARGPQLTDLGRRLAQLPVDPRMGRMVLEADRLGCANEVIVIAAALSIQDPRERPTDQQQAADQMHARFADEQPSDFLAYLNLWRYLREQQRELSGNQFRKRCRAEFLHHLRVREWQDLVSQLREAAKGVGVTLNHTPAEPDEIHRALLAGLLSHIGMKDAARREYLGARGARFAIFPGSSLARKQPAWVMAAELVETSRLWGREVARIQPQWVEPLAEGLVTRTYSEPHWERSRGSVVATERVTLYGLPIVTGRKVTYGGIDPALSRELFIRSALVERDWDTRHDFFHDNQALLDEAEELEHRVRRRDILVDDQVLFDFYDERIPADVVSGRHFDSWWKDERGRNPDLLTFPRSLLFGPEGAEALDPQEWPTGWKQGDAVLRLSYRFEPGTAGDGVTVHVPLTALAALRPDGFEWLVPGLRLELVTTLIRSLPKDLRRPLVPVPDVARDVLARLTPRREPLLGALARELEALRGVRIPPDAWDLSRLGPHLRMTYRVEEQDGSPVAEGDDLYALRDQVRPRLRAQLAAATDGIERSGLTAWTIGTLPRRVELHGVAAYPALVDEGASVGVRVLETAAAQAAEMQAGTRRLLLLGAPAPQKWVRDRLDGAAQLALAAAPHGSAAAVLDDAADAAADALIAEAGGPAWDQAGFDRLRAHVAGNLAERTLAILTQVVRILDLSRDVHGRLESLTAAALQPARDDIRQQLNALVYAGFVADSGAGRLPDLERYVQAMVRRIDRLRGAPGPDRDRMAVVHELEDAYRQRLAAWPAGRPLSAELGSVGWMLEELRVSQFAQGLGVRGHVSVKRIRRALEA
jgi:ATP-dependent helicase HrpA